MGELTCKVTHLIFPINLFGSVFSLTYMSVNCYLFITYFNSTSSHRKKMVCHILCALVWLLAFCVSVPDTYNLKTVTSASNNEMYCWSFYLENSIKEAILVLSDQEKHTSQKIIFSYMVVFLHLVVLLGIFSILHYLPFTCQLENALFTALHATQCLALVHCCVSSMLYSFINHTCWYKLMEAFVFKYSAETDLSKVTDTSRVSETECLVLKQNTT
ncbi:Atypical chemokine receptor 3 [Sciurus carolinensis]|uniref:Atypical chemokine receptor 3 n=1 Tax=Sciurus carolinensis TaxID=30640 RepID=A0AA41NB09_SCICA|nr:Atypical chemokine receptor 3 [Sciurus carolinensis]